MKKLDIDKYNPQKQLNNKLFKKDKTLDSRVRLQLLDIVDDFIKTLAVDWVKPEHIYIIGSAVSYNWNNESDIDINIIYDYKKIYNKTDFVDEYFYSKRNDWNNKHTKLKIKSFPIEMTVINKNNDIVSNGIYDLEKNTWVKEPKEIKEPNFNKEKINKNVKKYSDKIDDICKQVDSEKDKHKLSKLQNNLKKLDKELSQFRKKALNTKKKEMADNNITMKLLKHAGYIQKLRDYQNKAYDKQMTINEKKVVINENQYKQLQKLINKK